MIDDHGGWEKAKKWIISIYTHSQTYFCQPSLGTKIKLKYDNWEPRPNDIWDPKIASKEKFAITMDFSFIDIHSYVSGEEGWRTCGCTGYAGARGSICDPDKRSKNKITWRQRSSEESSIKVTNNYLLFQTSLLTFLPNTDLIFRFLCMN